MHKEAISSGSTRRWGPLFGSGAKVWADTWEGPQGWGGPAYHHVMTGAAIGDGTRVLDCGCGAGRFTRLAADAGADVAGIDAASEMIEIAAARTPTGEFIVGDLEALPWGDDTFDVVTGFSTFQFYRRQGACAHRGTPSGSSNRGECPSVFDAPESAIRAFLGAGPVTLASQYAGETAVAEALHEAVRQFTGLDERVTLRHWFRVVLAGPSASSPA